MKTAVIVLIIALAIGAIEYYAFFQIASGNWFN